MKFNLKPKKTAVVVVIWATSLLLGIFYSAQAKLSFFDPNSELAMNMQDIAFDSRLSQLLQENGVQVQNAVVHFTAEHCFCQRIAKRHIRSVKHLAQSQHYQNIEVSISRFTQLEGYIPSVPAIAVFNADAKLHYLGPYSTGLFCAPQKGLVERFIQQKSQAGNMVLGANIIHEASGCYCEV